MRGLYLENIDEPRRNSSDTTCRNYWRIKIPTQGGRFHRNTQASKVYGEFEPVADEISRLLEAQA